MSRIAIVFAMLIIPGWALAAGGELPPPVGGKAKVFFKSDPAGAAIVVAGQKLGVTPVMLELPVGKCEATMQLTGFEDKVIAIEVKPEMINRVETTLSGGGLKIEVKTTPPGAFVFIDDKMQNDADGTPLLTPCTLTLRQVHVGILAVAKLGYGDGIKKDLALKEGGKFEFSLYRGNSDLLGAGQDFAISPEEQVNQFEKHVYKPFQLPHKIKAKKFNGTLVLLVNALYGMQTSGVEIKQGTPLKIMRTGGRWHVLASNVNADPKQLPGALIGFKVGQVEVRFQDRYEGVAPDSGELFMFSATPTPSSWGAVEVTIMVGDCLQVAEPAPINTTFRPVFIPRGTPTNTFTYTIDPNKLWNPTHVEVSKGSQVRFTIKVTDEHGNPATTAQIRRVNEDYGFVLRVGDDPRDPLNLIKLNTPMEMPANGMIYLGPTTENWSKIPTVAVHVVMEGSLRLLPPPPVPGKPGN